MGVGFKNPVDGEALRLHKGDHLVSRGVRRAPAARIKVQHGVNDGAMPTRRIKDDMGEGTGGLIKKRLNLCGLGVHGDVDRCLWMDENTLLTNNIFVNIIKSMNVKDASAPAQSLPKADLAALQVSAERACQLLKVLANADRLVLLCRLTQGEFCVSEMEADLGIRQPTLSQQLTVLRNEGLVDTRRQGKHIYYRLISEDAEAVMQVLHNRLCGAALNKTALASPPTPFTKARSKS